MRILSAFASNSMLSIVGEYFPFIILFIVDFEMLDMIDNCLTEMFLLYMISLNNIFMMVIVSKIIFIILEFVSSKEILLMKKNSFWCVVAIPIVAFLALSGYSNNRTVESRIENERANLATENNDFVEATPTVEPALVNDPDSLDSYPFVPYKEITSEYIGKIISVECIRGKSNYEDNNCCGIWYPLTYSYVYESGPKNSDISDDEIDSPDYVFVSASEGDIIRFATRICDDGSPDTSHILAAKVVGHKDINEVYSAFKENSPYLNPDTFCRNPDKYKYVPVRTNGKILQILNEDSDNATYLLSTSTGCVYLNWYEDSVIRGDRLLEDDNVSVYGTFDGLETYNSLIGQKTVPKVNVYFIERE